MTIKCLYKQKNYETKQKIGKNKKVRNQIRICSYIDCLKRKFAPGIKLVNVLL